LIPKQARDFDGPKALFTISVLAGITTLIGACSAVRSPSAPPTFVPPPTATPPAGTTYTVRRSSVTEEIKARGRVTAIRESFLYFPLDGRLKEAYFIPGQQVTEGELLAEMDASSMEGQVIAANHALDMRQPELDHALADPQLETLAVLEAQVRQAELAVERAKIEATQSLADAAQALVLAQIALAQAEIEAAQRVDRAAQAVAQARNALWQAQIEPDGKKGEPTAGYTADVAEALAWASSRFPCHRQDSPARLRRGSKRFNAVTPVESADSGCRSCFSWLLLPQVRDMYMRATGSPWLRLTLGMFSPWSGNTPKSCSCLPAD